MGYETANDIEIYILCIEWATQTITTVGYGSIIAVNIEERRCVRDEC